MEARRLLRWPKPNFLASGRQVGVEAGAAGADKEKMATEKQIAANRRNALKSTGPKTKVGRQIVSRNAITCLACFCADV